MSANPFLVMLNILKAVTEKVAPELLDLADIRDALGRIEAYRRELESQPAEYAKLVNEKHRVEQRLPSREAGVKPPRHAARQLEEKLKKLRQSLEHNLESLAACPEPETTVSTAATFGIQLPASRKERVAQLETEIAEVEKQVAEAVASGKKAEALLKSDKTRLATLEKKIEEAQARHDANIARLPEMNKLAKKTADHLKNRQAHRDRRAAERMAKQPPPAEAPADEAPKAPTDEELRRKAERMFGQSITDEQLAELRQDAEFLDA